MVDVDDMFDDEEDAAPFMRKLNAEAPPMSDMTHEELVERVAGHCWNNRFGLDTSPLICPWEQANPDAREKFRHIARAAITATGLTEAQLEGLANGTMVCVVAAHKSEARVSLVARSVRKTLRDYGHSSAESSLPELIAADAERAMLAAKEG